MTTAAILLFLGVGIALIVGRRPMAQVQAYVMGGRIVPGCVIAEAIAVFLLALFVYVFRHDLG